MGLFQIGMRSDAEGNVMPTQDYGGIMRAASSQINPLSRGVRPGQFSSLGVPANTMYEQNPGFFRRGPNAAGFGQQIAQRNQAMQSGGIPNPQRPGYAGPYRPGFSGVTEQQKMQNRAALQEQVDAKRMLGEATGEAPSMQGIGLRGEPISTAGAPKMGEARNISGKYGTGFATFEKPGTKKEGLIGGRPASEVLQDLANKPGIARAGDRFQPQKANSIQGAELNKALSKFPMKNPLRKK